MKPVQPSAGLAAALFGLARRRVLTLLLCGPDSRLHLREIARRTSVSQGAVHRECNRLTRAGFLTRSTAGNQVHYQADRSCPIFEELRTIFLKTEGLALPLRVALLPLAARIRVAFVYGSIASGSAIAESDVDVLVVGDLAFREVVRALSPSEFAIGREINPSVFREAEFRDKLRHGHHFLTSVLRGPKIFLLGDEHELHRLDPQRLVGSAPDEPARSRGPTGGDRKGPRRQPGRRTER
ncbi:MAG: MarR family transcriptional regulator [Candidatus Wallbacteria bacterium]|nr:MarR family transcriptional regulator [Candidatus Wallbacteria bacterium]